LHNILYWKIVSHKEHSLLALQQEETKIKETGRK
jgi:hypothetical protein